MQVQTVLSDIERGKILDAKEAKQVMLGIISGEINDSQISALLFGLQLRGLHREETIGFSDTLLELCVQPGLPKEAIDLCGSGGDHKNTFNISTITSLLLGSMGYPVIKHGNYGSTSVTGSSQIMELLGYPLSADSNLLRYQFEKFGYCFIHAPFFHTALAKVAHIRRELKLRTIFNILGPISNPCNPTFRFHGANSIALLRLYSDIFTQRKQQFLVYHSVDGHDEITLTAPYVLYGNRAKKFCYPNLKEDNLIAESDIKNGNDPQESLLLFKRIMEGKGTYAQNTIVAHNTALAIHLYAKKNMEEFPNTMEKCLEFIVSGGIDIWFNRLISAQAK